MATSDELGIEDRIIVRRLSAADDPSRVVTVTIGRPHLGPDGDWICPFLVEGIDASRSNAGHGIDALQALLHALEGVRAELDASGLPLSWEGGEPGDVGVPRMVPIYYGRAFAERIERYIDEQVRGFAADAERAAQGPGRVPGDEGDGP